MEKTELLQRYQYWRKDDMVFDLPHTVNGILADDEKQIVSQDCCPDPCTCTGCSEWD